MHKTITLHPGDTLTIDCKDKTLKKTKKKVKTQSKTKENDISPFIKANRMFRERSRISEKRKKDRIKDRNNEIASLREQLSQSKQLAMIPQSNNECERQPKKIKLNKFTILPLINHATRTNFLV